MSATRILWRQLLFVSIVVLAFLWAATEWTAWCLAFQPQLGHAWFVIGRWPVYQPLAFFIWWFKFDAYAPVIFMQGACIRRKRRDRCRRYCHRPLGLAG